jgi:two-component system cell cycle sensor histidine kinase/response regulator CckA
MMKEENKKTILLIEDDEAVIFAMERYLKYVGFELIIAKDGIEGIKKVKSGGYDLVITDIVMPHVSGTGIVTVLKKTINPQIPIIAVTGYGKEAEAAAMEKDADLVLTKPVQMKELKNHIERLLASGGKG